MSFRVSRPAGTRRWWRAAAILLPALLFAGCNDDDDDGFVAPTFAVPQAPTLSPGDGTVTVMWPALAKAINYNVHWSKNPGGTANLPPEAKNVQGTSFTATGLENGETYHFAVSARFPKGKSQRSPETTTTLPPGRVDVLTLTADADMVTLDWTEPSGATSYNVYRDTLDPVDTQTAMLTNVGGPPFVDSTVALGQRYYYVVEPVGAGGAGLLSSQAGATVFTPTPQTPTSPAITLAEQSSRSSLVSWAAPSGGAPDSYNIYWDTLPGVTVGTNPILDVDSPFLHSGLDGQTTHYYVVTAVFDGTESAASAELSGVPRGEGVGGFGNNLSFPLVFANAFGLEGMPIAGTDPPHLDPGTGLRPTPLDTVTPFPFWDSVSEVELNGTTYFPQQTESTWQAEWVDGSMQLQQVVADWNDDLTSASYGPDSVILVETELYQDDLANPLEAFESTLLSGQGSTEVRGTDQSVFQSSVRNVFALNGRLTIDKLDGPGGAIDPSVAGFDGAIYENFGAADPGAFRAVVDDDGKLVYRYLWFLDQWDLTDQQKLGWWRITFSLDPQSTFDTPPVMVPNNVMIVAVDSSDPSATIGPIGESTSIELEITE